MKRKKRIILFLIFLIIILGAFFYTRSKEDKPNTIVKENKKNTEIEDKLLEKGYKKSQVSKILNKLSDNNINKLLEKDYIDINKYIDIKNFDVDNYERYENYDQNIDTQDIVTRVNINLDLKPYEKTNQIDDPKDTLVLVNKYNYLDQDFKPDDLETLSGYYGSVSVRSIAKEAFLKLQQAAKEENISLVPTTAYRSSEFQKSLYDKYAAKDGIEAADTYSARPGYSEHQAGLSLDLKDPNSTATRLTKSDYEWLKKNCSTYGFIIRFPHDKENITLYQEENWHIRYVGIDHAKIIMDNDLTLEEYIDLYIKEY